MVRGAWCVVRRAWCGVRGARCGMRNAWCVGRWVMSVVLIMLSLCVYAEEKEVKEKDVKMRMRMWTLGEGLIRVDTVPADTSYWNLPDRNVVNDYSIANSYNGNLVSPIESKIYFDREEKIDFLFGRAYQPYILTASDVRFFNTTKPYSYIAYKKGFKKYHEENDLDFAFSGNINRRINLGVTANYLTSVGHYPSQAGKRFNGSVFGSYNGDQYSFQGGVVLNNLSNFENGGIGPSAGGESGSFAGGALGTSDYLNGILETEDYPVRLNAMSAYKYITGFFNHYYSLCTERERQVTEDSVAIDYIPMTTFEHTFVVNQSSKRYVEKSVNQHFYDTTYFDTKATRDTAEMLTIDNTFAVTFEEEFNKWLRFGATVFAKNSFERYTSAVPTIDDAPIGMGTMSSADMLKHQVLRHNYAGLREYWTNNTSVGAAIYKKTGQWVRYHVQGDVCLAGYKLGEFKVRGNIDGIFPLGKDTLTVVADAYIRNEQPNYFLQHYMSNHYVWDNDFAKPYRMYIGGTVSYPTKWVQPSVNVRFENILNHIYFDRQGMPQQYDGNIQVLAVDAKVNLRSPWIALDNTVVYQHSSSEYLPLPTLALYSNLYYYDWWFNALFVQLGADIRYNTAYYAPLLNPATGQFCIQQEKKVGNFPVANLYANFYVKSLRLRLFVQWQNFNDIFTKDKQYYSMPDYPLNQATFRAGIAWSFYN